MTETDGRGAGLKVILQLYPVIPATADERATLRPIGRDSARYQATLRDWHDVVRAADDLGLWGVSTVEHHFHSEGYEVGPNPGLLTTPTGPPSQRTSALANSAT